MDDIEVAQHILTLGWDEQYTEWVEGKTPTHFDKPLLERAYFAILGVRGKDLKTFVATLSLPDEPHQETIYRIITGITRSECPNGSFYKFHRQRLYGFCGTNECACFVAHRKKGYAEKMTTDKKAEGRDKRKATNLERYGTDNPLQVEEFLTKARKGRDENAIWEKARITMAERYGNDNPMKITRFKDKAQETNLDQFGYTNASQSPTIKEKKQNTLLDNYGEDGLSHSSIREKKRQTNTKRYGVGNHTQMHIAPENIMVMDTGPLLKEMVDTNSLTGTASILGVHRATVGKRLRDHGFDIPNSSYETEIGNLLTHYGIPYVANTRKIIAPLELDFYIPDYNLAIEFNGLYWHSDRHLANDYHRVKYEACRRAGIRLLMINEDEWVQRKSAIVGKIITMCGMTPRGNGGRKLNLSVIGGKEANDFIDSYHIQGKTSTITHAVVARDQDKPVGVMAFNRQRNTQDIELIRFCGDGRSHAGMFSKMFKYAVNEFDFDKVISFADLRYSDGGVYAKNGFDLIGEIPPDYRYVVGSQTQHKAAFTKSKIASRYGICTEGMTERQLTETLGFPRIYDCGKLKYQWVKAST